MSKHFLARLRFACADQDANEVQEEVKRRLDDLVEMIAVKCEAPPQSSIDEDWLAAQQATTDEDDMYIPASNQETTNGPPLS